MKYISSDTNVWLDFDAISCVDFPFMLPYTYIMYKEALREEIIDPPELIGKLITKGLKIVELYDEELFLAELLSNKYKKISGYDSIALSIAINRKIVLLTGDAALRKAALSEGVDVIGTIGIIDKLLSMNQISTDEYKECLNELLSHPERRLPKEEIEKRLKEVRRIESRK